MIRTTSVLLTLCLSVSMIIGLTALPASVIAGLLWQGLGTWTGFGPSAPFLFGALMALLAMVLFWLLVR